MKKSSWPRLIPESDTVIIVEYGMWHHGNGSPQRPYFGITATLYGPNHMPGEPIICYNRKNYWAYGGGACHNEIVKAFPEYAELITFYLCDNNGEPMHYISNAVYWWRIHQRGEDVSGPPYYLRELTALDAFKKTICFGVLPDDEASLRMVEDRSLDLCSWLESRRPGLKAKFGEVMKKFGVPILEV